MSEEEQKKNRNLDLTQGSPLKTILLFSIPLLIGQLFHLLYTLVDTRMVGQLLGEVQLAAVGSTTTVCDMLIGFVNGVTNGFAIVLARFYGAKDKKGVRKCFGLSAVYGVILALVLSGLCLLFRGTILYFLQVPKSLWENAQAYLSIIAAGLLMTALYNIGASALRAIGDSVMPLLFLILSSVVNIGLDYLFMAVIPMGVGGAAFATVLSQGISAVCCLTYIRRKYSILHITAQDIRLDKSMTKKLLESGIGMGFMISFVQLGTVALQVTINTFDQAVIVAHTAARKATSLFMLPFSTLGSALATYAGQNKGAGLFDRIKQGLKRTVLLTWIWCGIVFAISLAFAPAITKLISASTNPVVLQTAARYLRINTAFYFVTAVICIFRNTMQGLGDTRTPVLSSSMEFVGKILIACFLAPQIGYFGIIIAEPIVWFIMVIPLCVNMRKCFGSNRIE